MYIKKLFMFIPVAIVAVIVIYLAVDGGYPTQNISWMRIGEAEEPMRTAKKSGNKQGKAVHFVEQHQDHVSTTPEDKRQWTSTSKYISTGTSSTSSPIDAQSSEATSDKNSWQHDNLHKQDNTKGNKKTVTSKDEANRKALNEIIRSRFSERLGRLKAVCQANHNVTEFKDLPGRRKVAYGRLFYCGIAKVGTSFTKYLQSQLFNTKPSTIFTGPEKRYVIVREPFSRMVSGYIGKIVTNFPWWKNFGRYIISNFRVKASKKNARCGNNVSFAEFIKYLIHMQETGRHKNDHWDPMNEKCSFCEQRYDYIVHLETLKDDLRYIYESVNISVDTDFSDEEMTMRDKARKIVSQRPETSQCEDTCVTLEKVWWSFHARGLVASDVPLPVKGKQCDTITGEEFADMAWKAHLESEGRIDKYKQREEALVEMFLSVPLKDRIRVRDLYREDFDLFGYDPEPPELFPELHKAKTT